MNSGLQHLNGKFPGYLVVISPDNNPHQSHVDVQREVDGVYLVCYLFAHVVKGVLVPSKLNIEPSVNYQD